MSSNLFHSKKDKDDCLEYCAEQFNKRKITNPSLEYYSKLIYITNTAPKDISTNDCLEFWSIFQEIIAKTVKNRGTDPLPWVMQQFPFGIWRIHHGDENIKMEKLPTLWKGLVSRHDEGAYQIHNYNNPLEFNEEYTIGSDIEDDKFIWTLLIGEQEGREVLVGSVNVGEIDAFSMVPHLPNFSGNQASSTLAKWSLDPDEGLYQWQRRPAGHRIVGIGSFMESSKDNLIINSIILYVPENAPGVEIKRDGKIAKVTIDPKKFLTNSGEELVDVTVEKGDDGTITYTDHRPIWIVDGQHRTRGMALSSRGFNSSIPVILTHGGGEKPVSLSEVAKLFAEINTLSKPLDAYQTHYLAHKFSIISPLKKFNYAPPDQGKTPEDKQEREITRRLYQLGCMLTDQTDGPWYNGVGLIDAPGPKSFSRIFLPRWLEISRKWFEKSKKSESKKDIYSDPQLTVDEIFDDLTAYLSAWQETANYHMKQKPVWTYMPNAYRWLSNVGRNTSWLEQKQAMVEIVLELLPFCTEVRKTRGLKSTKKNYQDILSPIRGIDWRNQNFGVWWVQNNQRGGPQYVAKWIKQSIIRNKNRTPDEINSRDINDVDHGIALWAPPSSPVITSTKGATGTSIILTWQNGNVYDAPRSVSFFNKSTQKTRLITDFKWTFDVPTGKEDQPSVAKCIINLDNSYMKVDWELEVLLITHNRMTRAEFITPKDLL